MRGLRLSDCPGFWGTLGFGAFGDSRLSLVCVYHKLTWEFPKIRGTLFGVLIIRILLFRVLC